MQKELEKLIEMALIDGSISPKEKLTLIKKAQSLNITEDELEIIIDAISFEKKQIKPMADHSEQATSAKSINKCPACNNPTKSFETKCPYCGVEYRNISASSNLNKFFEKLDEIESLKEDRNVEYSKREIGCLTLIKWSFFWWLLLPITIINRLTSYLSPVRWTTSDSRKEEFIMNFPVPNSREEIFEFINLSVSKIQHITVLMYLNSEVKYMLKWNTIWKKKAIQIYNKAKISMNDDTLTIKQIENILRESKVIKGK
jgi:hypothetical protein